MICFLHYSECKNLSPHRPLQMNVSKNKHTNFVCLEAFMATKFNEVILG